MTAKLRVKAKGIEIEWEGEVEYLKNDLPDLIAAIVTARRNTAGHPNSHTFTEVGVGNHIETLITSVYRRY
jgi:hypothetical protein